MAICLKSKLRIIQREADLYLKAIKGGGDNKHLNLYYLWIKG